MDDLIAKIKQTASPLRRQLLVVALVTRVLRERGEAPPVLIGGCALSYYTREVYFTADIDLAYPRSAVFDEVLDGLGFRREGRYWVQEDWNVAVECPAADLAGEDAPREEVELGEGLYLYVIGLEDLLIDRLNAWVHWKSAVDREMLLVLLRRYGTELDWEYLQGRAGQPENDVRDELARLRAAAEAVDENP